MSPSDLPTYAEAPEPLTERERALVDRIFSDYFEVPGEWKTALKADLERDPPILGKGTLGPGGSVLAPNSVTTAHIADGTITDVDVNSLNKDGTQATPSLRTLGTGHFQAAAGDDPRLVSGSDKNYVHTQGTPASNWAVAHNLGKFPAVMVVDGANSVIIPDVVYVDTNSLALAFGFATSGKAYVN